MTLTVDGGNSVIDGDGKYRGFFVYSGAVTIEDLTIQNAAAIGGVGGSGGGGGGAGLGGGLYVADNTADGAASPGDVTLENVTFSHDSAIGGAGGGRAEAFEVGGGGGGLGGAWLAPASNTYTPGNIQRARPPPAAAASAWRPLAARTAKPAAWV